MNIPDRFIKIAIEEAYNSTHPVYKVGAVIFDKRKLISKGHNYPQRSARKLHPKFQKWPNSIHAEVDCILKAKTGLKSMSILVLRVNNNKQFRNSKPCDFCYAYLNHVGIKDIYYTVDHYPYIKKL